MANIFEDKTTFSEARATQKSVVAPMSPEDDGRHTLPYLHTDAVEASVKSVKRPRYGHDY